MDKERMLELMEKNARDNGYFICPDPVLLDELLMGLVLNLERYGYGSCPCRMSSGIKSYDADIICPCEYRDADVDEHGMCYCGLFVSKVIKEEPEKLMPIPERRPVEVIDASMEAKAKKDEGILEEETAQAEETAAGNEVLLEQNVENEDKLYDE